MQHVSHFYTTRCIKFTSLWNPLENILEESQLIKNNNNILFMAENSISPPIMLSYHALHHWETIEHIMSPLQTCRDIHKCWSERESRVILSLWNGLLLWMNMVAAQCWTWACDSWHRSCGENCLHATGGRFKNAYELLTLRALKISMFHKNFVFQCMGQILCVEFQRYPLKFHTKYLIHTLKDVYFIHMWKFKSS